MARKTDLEGHIRESYGLIRQYEEMLRLSADPKEQARSRRGIEEQWELIERYLAEYVPLCEHLSLTVPEDITEISVTAGISLPSMPPDELAPTSSLVGLAGSLTEADTFTRYETGLTRLLERVGKDHLRYADALTFQARLLENIGQARRYGDTDALRHARAQIVDALNCLALEAAEVSFNDLCSGAHVESRKVKAMAIHPTHLFLCYKRNVDPDQKLAQYLHDFLTTQGHDVFIDGTLRTGEAWLEEIDRQIKASDFLVVLLSKESADSEMVQAEVRRAYEYRKLQGRPHTLPVRIAYEGLLPYPIDAFLDPLQYVVWQSDTDNERVGREILAAIEGRLPKRVPIHIRPVAAGDILSEDGRPVADEEILHPPLPEFDPRFLEELEAPGGAVKLRDRFYIERDADGRLKREAVKSGTTTTIRAPRQTGKSSLLVRGVHHARQNGAKIVNLDMQRIDRDHLETPDVFLHYLAEFIVRRLRLDVAEVEKLWRGSLGPQDKLTYLMEDYILPESDASIVLALDEADRLLQTTFYKDFFALVRSWHNSRALDDRWNKLNVVMVISTEPHLLIADVTQSPFNVGLKLYLEDFSDAQVRDLNRRHGSPVKKSDFHRLMVLLSGHPYLTRKAFYTLVTEWLTWADLTRVAAADQGPFGDHLRHHHWLLRDERGLREALKQVIHNNRCTDEMAFFRLLRAGLVKGSGESCTCRCDLYRMYFKGKL